MNQAVNQATDLLRYGLLMEHSFTYMSITHHDVLRVLHNSGHSPFFCRCDSPASLLCRWALITTTSYPVDGQFVFNMTNQSSSLIRLEEVAMTLFRKVGLLSPHFPITTNECALIKVWLSLIEMRPGFTYHAGHAWSHFILQVFMSLSERHTSSHNQLHQLLCWHAELLCSDTT